MKAMTKTAFIYITLGVIVVLIIAIFIGQQRTKTEQTIFTTIWNKFFPNRMESVVIPGTTAGGGCPTIKVDTAETMAQSILDCWRQGKTYKNDIECCYNITAAEVKTPFHINEVATILKQKSGKTPADVLVWQINSQYIAPNIQPFTVCFDRRPTINPFMNDEIYVTYNPKKECT